MKKKISILFIYSFFGFLFSSCNPPEYYQIRGFAQGTTYNIIYKTSKNQDFEWQIDSILKSFDKSLSTYDSSSLISSINRNEDILVDSLFFECFVDGQKVAKETNGAFDMTVGPLVKAYGFYKKKGIELSPEKIDSFLQFIGYQKVRMSGLGITKEDNRIMLDVNAIAQGYSVDVVCRFLDENEITDYLVEIGGELKTKGLNSKAEEWRVGIDKPIENSTPDNRELETIIHISNRALATSGNYRKFYIKNGKKYAHTINPVTGYPAENELLSASVVASECVFADAYATAFMTMGLEKSLQFINSHKNKHLEAYFIYTDSTGKLAIKMTDGFKSFIIE